MDANSFVLVSWYFDIWNLFSREFVFAGATFECSFCCVIGFERIGDVVWMAISGISPKPPLCLLGFVFVFSPPDDA